MQYKRISADCHLDLPWLPPELFVSGAKRELKDRMPYVEEGPDGPYWITKAGVNMGLVGGIGSVGGKFVPGQNYRVDKMAETGLYEDGKKGVRRPGDPDQRIKDMDRDGVDAEIISASSASPHGSATTKQPMKCCAFTTTGSRISAPTIPTARSALPVCPMAISKPRSRRFIALPCSALRDWSCPAPGIWSRCGIRCGSPCGRRSTMSSCRSTSTPSRRPRRERDRWLPVRPAAPRSSPALPAFR